MIVIGLLVLAPLVAIVGVTLFDLTRRRSLRRMALRNIVRRPVEALLVVVGAFFLPEKQAVPFIALGGGIGLVLGGSQALSRSLFSQLIPKGREGEYFGLYEISDKGTSWLGPLLFGLAYDITRSYRVAIFSLLVFFVVGMVLLFLVPMRRAIEAAGNTPPSRL